MRAAARFLTENHTSCAWVKWWRDSRSVNAFITRGFCNNVCMCWHEYWCDCFWEFWMWAAWCCCACCCCCCSALAAAFYRMPQLSLAPLQMKPLPLADEPFPRLCPACGKTVHALLFFERISAWQFPFCTALSMNDSSWAAFGTPLATKFSAVLGRLRMKCAIVTHVQIVQSVLETFFF